MLRRDQIYEVKVNHRYNKRPDLFDSRIIGGVVLPNGFSVFTIQRFF
jgi:hypothetical protein